MRSITVVVLFFASLAHADCPKLEGRYGCMFYDGTYSELRIGHEYQTETVHEYRFDYLSIPGDPDVILADDHGIRDSEGWVTRCTKGDRLRSITADGAQMSELYLDRDGALVRADNEVVSQRCPRLHRR